MQNQQLANELAHLNMGRRDPTASSLRFNTSLSKSICLWYFLRLTAAVVRRATGGP